MCQWQVIPSRHFFTSAEYMVRIFDVGVTQATFIRHHRYLPLITFSFVLNIFCWYFLIYYWVQVSSKMWYHSFLLGTTWIFFQVNIHIVLKLTLKILKRNFTCIIILMFDIFRRTRFFLLKDFGFSRVSMFILFFLFSSWETLITDSCSR